MKLNNSSIGSLLTRYLRSGSPGSDTVIYTFGISVDSGPRNGHLFSGAFSYIDTPLAGIGEEYLDLDSFDFTFEGITLSLAEDTVAEAAFFDGVFLGVSYNAVTPDFSVSFVPGNFDPTEAYFSYDMPGTGTGFGTLTVTATPPPATLPFLLSGLGALGLIGRQRRN